MCSLSHSYIVQFYSKSKDHLHEQAGQLLGTWWFIRARSWARRRHAGSSTPVPGNHGAGLQAATALLPKHAASLAACGCASGIALPADESVCSGTCHNPMGIVQEQEPCVMEFALREDPSLHADNIYSP